MTQDSWLTGSASRNRLPPGSTATSGSLSSLSSVSSNLKAFAGAGNRDDHERLCAQRSTTKSERENNLFSSAVHNGRPSRRCSNTASGWTSSSGLPRRRRGALDNRIGARGKERFAPRIAPPDEEGRTSVSRTDRDHFAFASGLTGVETTNDDSITNARIPYEFLLHSCYVRPTASTLVGPKVTWSRRCPGSHNAG